MTDAVKQTNDQLIDAIDPTKKVWRRDSNNLAAAGQIQMQFSSIMKTVVNSPDQLMEVATAQSKVDKMNADPRNQTTERDDFRGQVREQREAAGRDVDRSDRSDDHRSDRPKQVDKPKAQARDTSNDDSKSDTTPSTDVQAPVEKKEAKVGKSFQEDVLDAQQAAAPDTQPQDIQPVVNPAVHAERQQANAELAHGAQSQVAGALANKNFSREGEDLHDAADTAHIMSRSNHVAGPTAASSLKDEQESDLSNRLSGQGQFQIQVDTANEAAKAKANPTQGLNGANVNFGSFDGLDATADNQPNPITSDDGFGMASGSEHKTAAAQVAAAQTTVGNAQQAQSLADLAVVMGQAAARTQAAMGQSGQAAGGDTNAIAPINAIQAVGAAAPAGPTQLSQSAKANSTTPAQQPEKPKEQTAAEQIAVKIRQAVGDGVDKINIKLNPHELGRVEVKLELAKDGSVTATVLAERQETLDMLQKDVRGLQNALNDAGLRTDATSLSFGLRGDTQRDVAQQRDRKNGSNNRNNERADVSRIEFAETAGTAKSGGYQRTLGLNRGVDLRV